LGCFILDRWNDISPTLFEAKYKAKLYARCLDTKKVFAMSKPIIKVENLSKRYRIGAKEEGYRTFREAIVDGIKSPIRNLKRLKKLTRFDDEVINGIAASSKSNSRDAMPSALCSLASSNDVIWALRDASFQVQTGEVVGIIGSNGAGKTTLLKILSRITEPTTGEAKLYGRVSSLLEVGTGFHPELTGRENIYLNGTILGLRKREIDRKFDEIVDFAEIEKFIYTPVKRYSSGMYVRLAFAVAAHLDPEILLVDEVLAVGDLEFQKKCLSKMEGLAQTGRTVLFVSHNMGAIKTFCDRAILIDKGKIIEDGRTIPVVNAYLNQGTSAASQTVWEENEGPGNQSFRLVSVTLRNVTGAATSEVNISEDAFIEIEYEVISLGAHAMFCLGLWDASGNLIFNSLSNGPENSYHGESLQAGRYRATCLLYSNLLSDGHYYVSVVGSSKHWSDSFRVDPVLSFDALDDGVLKRDFFGEYRSGVVRPKLTWQTNPIQR